MGCTACLVRPYSVDRILRSRRAIWHTGASLLSLDARAHITRSIVLNADQVEEPDLIEYMSNKPASHFWLGPHAHVVSYSLKAGKQLNIVLLVPDDLPESVNRAKGETGEMMALFDGWDPLLRRFLAKVDSVDKWRLMHRMSALAHSNGDVR